MNLSADVKSILNLPLATDPRWVNLAAISIGGILTDHAYCEQKAAISCISLIQHYSSKKEIVYRLSPIVTEEWGHFRLVLQELERRNLPLGNQRKDVYVNQLLAFQQKGGHEDSRLLDKLLTMALIEARSCERFKRLSEGLEDAGLRNFYRRFMASEAGHYTLFLDLAKQYTTPEKVEKRWQQWLEHEMLVMQSTALRGDRIH
ncbi:MAG: tRNA-(ms[2]io[6]A)-hydroxylase [Hydrotalea flava]|uniref:tRNA-(ms[2]io[6]A)-hydroxylase n=1 Tax=Hydrotalea TaxID=1004300 RepID=UPI0009437A35|nr:MULTISPECIES: tRNA-(ms[2]io[6]A)-hydroxylase [Hydrotalea]MBY0347356.1 tRNA-(ms[2]io[6]A)-hydroxylase [Hydrotalea flava]RWZ87940.1 MAG: tRNA-(ms[2]io[6]A)-hydroxylase [Hydrotalea sp. AMD]